MKLEDKTDINSAGFNHTKFISKDASWPLCEVYYSAFDLSVYHTCLNCEDGQRIPNIYLRRTYIVPSNACKCAICEYLETTGQAILGVPWDST